MEYTTLSNFFVMSSGRTGRKTVAIRHEWFVLPNQNASVKESGVIVPVHAMAAVTLQLPILQL